MVNLFMISVIGLLTRKEDRMSNLNDDVRKEVERRVAIIESPDYEFVPGLTKVDKIAVLVSSIILTVLLIVVYNVWV